MSSRDAASWKDPRARSRGFWGFWGSVRKVFTIYLVLWALTATLGLRQIDLAFDQGLAQGSIGMGGAENYRSVQVERVPFFEASDPSQIPEGVQGRPWRCRSRGIAVAPFVVLDRCAWQTHSFGGWAGDRLVFWVCGYVRAFPVRQRWVN